MGNGIEPQQPPAVVREEAPGRALDAKLVAPLVVPVKR